VDTLGYLLAAVITTPVNEQDRGPNWGVCATHYLAFVEPMLTKATR
jgi:hypothetical protein